MLKVTASSIISLEQRPGSESSDIPSRTETSHATRRGALIAAIRLSLPGLIRTRSDGRYSAICPTFSTAPPAQTLTYASNASCSDQQDVSVAPIHRLHRRLLRSTPWSATSLPVLMRPPSFLSELTGTLVAGEMFKLATAPSEAMDGSFEHVFIYSLKVTFAGVLLHGPTVRSRAKTPPSWKRPTEVGRACQCLKAARST